ncbi:MAG: hypothetical protein KZQ63_00345, partial [Candidatus Thiodiazotropha sp. (ex Lucinoma aequizonata)]|nr:hypothetical protein [Candidatus Thiodiazotropha sp. (ex Lucinoma aequizonata)]
SACIDNEARYNQTRQYGFSEKMSFLPGTNYVGLRMNRLRKSHVGRISRFNALNKPTIRFI